MGSLLVSIELISLIIILFKKDLEIEYKIIIGLGGYLLITLSGIIFNLNIIIYIISVLSVGLWLKYKTNYNFYETKKFLIVVCGLTFVSINAWGFAATGILWNHFNYGLLGGLIKGFTDMNSSFDFMVELANELLLQKNTVGIPEELRVITKEISTDISKYDTIKTIIELLEYL